MENIVEIHLRVILQSRVLWGFNTSEKLGNQGNDAPTPHVGCTPRCTKLIFRYSSIMFALIMFAFVMFAYIMFAFVSFAFVMFALKPNLGFHGAVPPRPVLVAPPVAGKQVFEAAAFCLHVCIMNSYLCIAIKGSIQWHDIPSACVGLPPRCRKSKTANPLFSDGSSLRPAPKTLAGYVRGAPSKSEESNGRGQTAFPHLNLSRGVGTFFGTNGLDFLWNMFSQ